jgi:hypothetical protein
LLFLSDLEKSFYRIALDFGADNADLARNIRGTRSDLGLAGYIVEVDPLSAFALNDALGPENHAVSDIVVELAESLFDLSLAEGLGSLKSDALENLICVVMMVLVVMVMAAACAVFAVLVVMIMFVAALVIMLVLVIMLMFMLMLVVVVVMVMGMFTLVLFCLEEGCSHIFCRNGALDGIKDLNT